MKALLPRLLSLLGAAAMGCALTLALLPEKAAVPEPSAVPEQAPLPLALAEAVESPPANELAERIFEGYHEAVVAEFVRRPGFSFGRTSPHPGFPLTPASFFGEHDFTFIGNDPAQRRYEVEDAALEGQPLVFRMAEAISQWEAGRNAIRLPNTDPFLPVRLPDHALFDQDLKPDVSLPTEAEFAILARFEASPEKRIELHPVPGGTLGYGAVRAAAACVQCHEKEESALLGLFRYRFEHGPAASLEDLALR